ncbi:hypothetical protein APED_14250 [Acanthopleuribacter pedis]
MIPRKNKEEGTFRDAQKKIDRVNAQISKLKELMPENIQKTAEWSALSSSAVLAGVIGGVSGIAAGISYGALMGLSASLCGPLGLLAGCSLAVLSFRGPRVWRFERDKYMWEKSLRDIRKEIQSIEASAKPDVVAQLWSDYLNISHEYHGWILREINRGKP